MTKPFHSGRCTTRDSRAVRVLAPALGMALALTGCDFKESPASVNAGPTRVPPAVVSSPDRIPREQVSLRYRHAPDSNDTIPRFDVVLMLGSEEVKIATTHGCADLTPGEHPGVPNEAFSAVGGYYAGAGQYFFVVEEDGRYVVKVTYEDEGGEGGEGGFAADPAKAEVLAVFSVAGKRIMTPRGKPGGHAPRD